MSGRIVTIYSTSSEIEANRVTELLTANGIESQISNAKPQDLFGMGRLGSGYNLAVGMVEVRIHENQQEKALQMLQEEMGLADSAGSSSKPSEIETDQPSSRESDTQTHEIEQKKRHNGYAIRSVVLSAAWLFGIGSLLGIYFGIRGAKYRPVLSAFGIFFGTAGLLLLMWFIRWMV